MSFVEGRGSICTAKGGSRKGKLTFKREKNKNGVVGGGGGSPLLLPLPSPPSPPPRIDYNEHDEVVRSTACIGLKGIRVSTDDFIVISLLDLHERCIITPLANRPDKRLSFYGLIIE